jgi:hypothetical protein
LIWASSRKSVEDEQHGQQRGRFLTCARYGLMLAEQMGDDFIRASLLKLVRAWLAAAKEIEKGANNVLVEIAAGP